MRREIEDRVVVDHEDDRMPRRRGAALRDMRVHDGRAGDRPTVEQPVPRLGLSERAQLSRQALVGGPGDRRHEAHETVGASGIPKVSRPELGLGPTTRFIEHVRSLARPPEAAKSARDMRSLAHKRKMWVTVRVEGNAKSIPLIEELGTSVERMMGEKEKTSTAPERSCPNTSVSDPGWLLEKTFSSKAP